MLRKKSLLHNSPNNINELAIIPKKGIINTENNSQYLIKIQEHCRFFKMKVIPICYSYKYVRLHKSK